MDPAGHCVLLASGAKLPYDRLLLATGSSAVRLRLPGIDLPRVATLDNLADAERILALARLAHEGVQIHTRCEIAAIEEKRGRVAAVLTTAGQRIPCALVPRRSA